MCIFKSDITGCLHQAETSVWQWGIPVVPGGTRTWQLAVHRCTGHRLHCGTSANCFLFKLNIISPVHKNRPTQLISQLSTLSKILFSSSWMTFSNTLIVENKQLYNIHKQTSQPSHNKPVTYIITLQRQESAILWDWKLHNKTNKSIFHGVIITPQSLRFTIFWDKQFHYKTNKSVFH